MYLPPQFWGLAFLPLIIVLLTVNMAAQPHANPIKWEHIGKEQGLASPWCTRLFQDQRGFLWIGNTDRLQRYDGIKLKSYTISPSDSVGISESYHQFLTEDKSGNLWVITFSGKLYRYDEAIDNFRHFPLTMDWNYDRVDDVALAILQDRWGAYWIRMSKSGLCQLDLKTGIVTKFLPIYSKAQRWVELMQEDAEGNIWLLGDDLYCVKPPTGNNRDRSVKKYSIGAGSAGLLYTLEVGKNGLIWAGGFGDKIYSFDPKTEKIQSFQYFATKPTARNSTQRINCIKEDSHGNIWLAVNDGGLSVLDPTNGSVIPVWPDLADPDGLKSNTVMDIIEDNSGQIWISSWAGGVYKYAPRANQFGHVRSVLSNPQTLSNPIVNAFTATLDGIIWVGTMDGLNRFDPKTKSIKRFKIPSPDSDLHRQEILALEVTNTADNVPAGLLWVGTGKGLKLFNPQNGQFSDWRSSGPESEILERAQIENISRSAGGQLFVQYIFSGDYLKGFYLDKSQKKFQPLQLPDAFDVELLEYYRDKNANFWKRGDNSSILKYNWDTNELKRLHIVEKDRDAFSNVFYLQVYTGSNGQQWILSDQGLFLLVKTESPDSFGLRPFDIEKRFINNDVKAILEDSLGNFWISTAAGISCFNPMLESFKNYSTDGLESTEFKANVAFKSRGSGHLFFGGVNGFNFFHPDGIQKDTVGPPVAITSVKVLREKAMERIFPQPQREDQAPYIEIRHSDRVLTIEFAALHFANPERNQYAYQLEGFDKDWRQVGNEHAATYTNLDPGKYLFRVKAANKDGVWNETGVRLVIRVLPPWWKTWWAYLVYLSLVGAAAYLIFFFLKKRWQLQNDLKIKEAETIRLKELDNFKSRLYTNLTHEFRTPLTVILGMAGQIKNNPSKYLKEGTHLIETNGQNLLRLINQLLDLSKLENKSFQLNLQQGDIVLYLRYITESFQSFANDRNLSLRFFTTLDSLEMDYDPEQIKQVLTNLISNALKFTPSGGEVAVRLTSSAANLPGLNNLEIRFIDNGIGISKENTPHIFDRFYQVDGSNTREGEGTGIGLAHTQELVQVMGGDITVESEVGVGSTFFVRLPITKNAPMSAPAAPNRGAADVENSINLDRTLHVSPNTYNSELPQLLIIEDNPDVVVYLKSCLESLYQIDVAYNGNIGIEKALESIPDLIISDVMMPGKDGYQVCDTLKNDDRTSHIPIILLTAKADVSSKIAGLRRGADAYLTKPFDKEELLVWLEKLVERQHRMAAYFSKKISIGNGGGIQEPAMLEAIEVENVFIQKMRQIVTENFEDENFGLPQLCQKAGMSRSQLLRKMKALIDESPSDFIRNHRLNEAKKLLETTDLNVSEVAWKVGYKDLAHFSKSFQGAFGVLPSSVSK